MSEIADEIERMRQMSTPELKARYRALWGKEPRIKNKTWLWKRCAWKLQEIHYGGLSEVAKRRLEELIAEIELPLDDRKWTATDKLRTRRRPNDPVPGTTITRRWKERDLLLHVHDNGFELDGVVYSSLSAAAHGVTGSRWNGRLFWGLTPRRKSQ